MVLAIFILQVFENLMFSSSSGGKEGVMSYIVGPLLDSNSCLVTETNLLKIAYQIRTILPPLPPDETKVSDFVVKTQGAKNVQNVTHSCSDLLFNSSVRLGNFFAYPRANSRHK